MKLLWLFYLKFIKNNESDFSVLSKLGCYEYETKGSGISTVIAGIFLTCKYSSEPLKGIEQAVNSIGTDTDSIAAFAGGLIGALNGQSIIPTRWKSVQDYEYLDKVADRLLAISQRRSEHNKTSVKFNNLKSISTINSDDFKVQEEIYLESLGKGLITHIDKQNTITKGKYNLILSVNFDLGQSCTFSKLLNLDDKASQDIENESSFVSDLLQEHKHKFSDHDYMKLKGLMSIGDTKKIIRFLVDRIPSSSNQ